MILKKVAQIVDDVNKETNVDNFSEEELEKLTELELERKTEEQAAASVEDTVESVVENDASNQVCIVCKLLLYYF